MAIEITDANFQEMVVNAGQPAMIDFWAEWCGPCRMLTPVVKELSEEYAGRVVVGKVDVDSNPVDGTGSGCDSNDIRVRASAAASAWRRSSVSFVTV